MMIYTAVMVPATDFLIGVLSALVLYGLLYRFFDRSPPAVPVPRPHESHRVPVDHPDLVASES
jgi:hypothetical protein